MTVRIEEGKGQHAEDGAPDDVFAADAVADGASGEGSDGGCAQEQEQVDLRALDGDVEFIDQIEDVVGAEAGQVNIFRKNERDEDAHRDGHFSGR